MFLNTVISSLAFVLQTADPSSQAGSTGADGGSGAPDLHPLLRPLEDWVLANPGMAGIVVALGVLIVGEILHRIFRHYVLRFVEYVAEHSPVDWDQAFFEARLPQRLAWGVPLLVWYSGIVLVPGLPGDWETVIRRVLLASMVVVVVRGGDALLNGVNLIYQGLPRARERPIKGFLQVANVVIHLAGLILVVSIVMDRSPVIFLSGLGAMTAVILLVFRDTLLSLVAGIQITTNDLIRVGDWIEMPQFQADGDVVDIALNSVTVQNWDRTLTVIPTHKFLEHSFRNWRGMVASGGRRIMRSFHLDLNSVRFLDQDEVDEFQGWELLKEYVTRKRAEVEEHNRIHQANGDVRVPHHRRLTNLGMLRAYLSAYLQSHPDLRHDMILMVRQLEPEPEGIPMQIYAFTADTAWPVFEGVQADIFDHILAIVPRFGLRIYQKPSGSDLRWALGGEKGRTVQPVREPDTALPGAAARE
jgi:miniconductance mechanosensitive channel